MRPMSPTYYVYVSNRGNVFMTEIVAVLAARFPIWATTRYIPLRTFPSPVGTESTWWWPHTSSLPSSRV